MNYSSFIVTARQLISAFDGTRPLHLYLKKFFSQNKKYGSRDRKLIAALCYNYFRLGFAFKDIPEEERILTGFFLCEITHSNFLNFFKPAWNEKISMSIEEKLNFGTWQSEIKNVFPFKNELSNGLNAEKFNPSFLYQPKLFIRIRPGKKDIVFKKLQEANLQYTLVDENCVSLENSSKIDTVLKLDKEAVVQDYNSQRTAEFIKSETNNLKSKLSVWDCCAGSGGKSIMAYDINPEIHLTVTDKRKTILNNLEQRFSKAGIKNHRSFTANLADNNFVLFTEKFDLIIADVPCTGSGTWVRTPEQLYFFDRKQIDVYSSLQKQILQNVVKYLKPGGYLLYITCSVFKKENEDVINFIKEKFNMEVLKMELLKGYNMQADTMFAALLAPSISFYKE